MNDKLWWMIAAKRIMDALGDRSGVGDMLFWFSPAAAPIAPGLWDTPDES